MSDAILLDTHAALWLTDGSLGRDATAALATAALGDGILVSPITAWEVGKLCGSAKKVRALRLDDGPVRWFERLLSICDIRECVLDSQIALASTLLPGNFHEDPGDRMLIATARALNCPLMTRDKEILAYAAHGHLKAIPC